VGAAICELAARGSTFIFATHLHNITEISEVTSLSNVVFRHLSVRYDEISKKLIYDRKLKEGSGSSVYGLEVCKALDLPQDFLTLANTIRQKYINVNHSIVSCTKSKYNAKVLVDVCSLCGNDTEEIHHIKQQKDADSHGFIKGSHVHMNSQHNLVNVCSKCHDDIHGGKIHVKGYVQTSDGIELDWEKKQDNPCDSCDKDLMMQVLALKKTKMSVANIAKQLDITVYKVNKLIKLGTS
jgi:DNA mismatch repair protein MutS